VGEVDDVDADEPSVAVADAVDCIEDGLETMLELPKSTGIPIDLASSTPEHEVMQAVVLS
jgi:hypothetical protein